jgi:hypothetical protein
MTKQIDLGEGKEALILSNDKETQIMKIPLGRRDEGWIPRSLNGRFICSNLRLSLFGWSELRNTSPCEMIKWEEKLGSMTIMEAQMKYWIVLFITMATNLQHIFSSIYGNRGWRISFIYFLVGGSGWKWRFMSNIIPCAYI